MQKHFDLGGKLRVQRIGFGMMRLTGQPGNFGPYSDWAAGIALLQRAAELGVDFYDSAWSYGPETADQLLGEALGDQAQIRFATKGGVDKPQAGKIVVDGSRDTLHRQIDGALKNLRRDTIELFQLHRVDPQTPLEDSVAALEAARVDGRIQHIGLSNVTREQLDQARGVAPIAAVQNRFNMDETGDDELVDYAAGLGIAFLPYGPLGAHPMQQGARLEPEQALGWLLQRSPNMVVIPGTTSVAHMEENGSAWSAMEVRRGGAGECRGSGSQPCLCRLF